MTQTKEKQPVAPEFISITQFASLVGVDRSTANRWAHEGTIEAVQVGQKWMVPISYMEKLKARAEGNAA